jgi:hypothetical protein
MPTFRLDIAHSFVCDSQDQAIAFDEAVTLAIEQAMADHGVRIKVGGQFALASCEGDGCLGMVLCSSEGDPAPEIES